MRKALQSSKDTSGDTKSNTVKLFLLDIFTYSPFFLQKKRSEANDLGIFTPGAHCKETHLGRVYTSM